MMEQVRLYSVWKRGTPWLTTHDITDDEDAKKLGFKLFEPKNGRYQFCIEKPNKKRMPFFKEVLKRHGFRAKVLKYTEKMSEELGWQIWDGYKYGFKNAPEVQKIVDNFIKTDPDHSHLAAARFICAFKKGKPQKDDFGRFTWAYVQTTNAGVKRLGKYDFYLVIYSDVWDLLNKVQVSRLIDHELMHCRFEGSPYLIGHDIEEFTRMYKKYKVEIGGDIYQNVQTLMQTYFNDDEDDPNYVEVEKGKKRK